MATGLRPAGGLRKCWQAESLQAEAGSQRRPQLPSRATEDHRVSCAASPFVCKRFAEKHFEATARAPRDHEIPANKREHAGGPQRGRTADLRRAKASTYLLISVCECH